MYGLGSGEFAEYERKKCGVRIEKLMR